MADQGSMNGQFSWNELVTTDVAKAGEFYTKLLGWSTQDMPMPTGAYTIFKQGEDMVGGMFQITPEMGQVPPMWCGYITVANVDESAKKAEELGAKIIVPPMDIPTVGRFCTITDPTGAAVSLITYLPR